MKCKLNSLTVNRADGSEADYKMADYVLVSKMSWDQAIEFVAGSNPGWTSMVIVVTNPEASHG
jgi:hypothetical protein